MCQSVTFPLILINVYLILVQCELCRESATIVNGDVSKKFCSGDLIFQDDFNEFNLKRWRHERTLAGGGVSVNLRINR